MTAWNAVSADAAVMSALQRDSLPRPLNPCVRWSLRNGKKQAPQIRNRRKEDVYKRQKIYITGKGRCNVTNACEPQELFDNVVSNSKFLYSAFYGFDNNAVQQFFETHGCPLKTERGNRVFPVSDHSSDVIRALSGALEKAGVEIRLHTPVKKLFTEKAGEEGSLRIKGCLLYTSY